MKLARLFLYLFITAFVLLLVVAGVAYTSSFQTWAARKALAGSPDLHASLGRVSAGLHRVELSAVRLEQRGAVLTLPSLVVDLPLLSAAVSQKISVTRLVAKGWTLDLTRAAPTSAPAAPARVVQSAPSSSLLSTAQAADPVAVATAATFEGIFSQLKLPVDLALDGVDLEGDVLLPGAPGAPASRAHVKFVGGGLAAGREGRFSLESDVVLTGTDLLVDALKIRATLIAAMDSPRTFTRLSVETAAAATGKTFPAGVKLVADLAAIRASTGENYTAAIVLEGKELVAVRAEYPSGAKLLNGTWKLNVRTADLAPFALGRPIGAIDAAGEGQFTTDAAFAEVRASGRLDAAVDQLGAVSPELASVGAVKLTAEFDLAQRGQALRVDRLTAQLIGAAPVASVRLLQPFEFNATTGEVKVADPASELLLIDFQGVPLAWARPLLKDLTLTGGDLHGEFAATASKGGLALTSRKPLTVSGFSLASTTGPLLRALDLSLALSADYTPQGWQTEVSSLALTRGGTTLLTLTAKAGRLAGVSQSIKATGNWSADLPAILAQPAIGQAGLLRGQATGDFRATIAEAREIYAKLALTNLAADPKLTRETLPTMKLELRADIDAAGKITLQAPLLFEREGRKSDLLLAGTATTGTAGLTLDARLSSDLLVVEDVQLLAAPFGSAQPAPGTRAVPDPVSVADKKPFWNGVGGQFALALKKVVYAQKFEMSDVGGTLRLEAGELKLEGVRAGFGDDSALKLTGGLTFVPVAPEPYALTANLDVANFDPAPLFLALNPGQPATVEGRFNIVSQLSGHGLNLADLGPKTRGDFQLTSKGGVFRGLPVSVSSKAESTSRLAAGVALVGSALSSVTGKKEYADIAGSAQAVAELTKYWQAITYDQLSLVLSRDASLNTLLKNFTLIAPEIRLSGSGQATHRPGVALLDQALTMNFKLGARGRHAELLKFLGVMEPQVDNLGYAACTLPLNVGGTLGKPDTSELNNALLNLTLEKSGAAGLLNKLLGGK